MTIRVRLHPVRAGGRTARLAVVAGVLLLGVTATTTTSIQATTTDNTWACTTGNPSKSCASSTLAAMPSARRELSAATAADGRIVAFGGQNISGGQANDGALSTVEAYTPSTNSWACSVGDTAAHCTGTTIPAMPTARLETVAVRGSDNRLYVFGGVNGSTTYDRVEAYNPTTNSWACSTDDTACPKADRTLAPMPSARDDMAVAATTDGHLYLVGGENSSGTKLALVQAYLPSSNTWSTVQPMGAARDDLAAATGSDGRIYAVGGNNGTATITTVEAYTPSTNSWATLAPLSTSRDDLAAVSGPCGRIYAMAGDNNDALLATTEVYTIATKTWTSVSPIPTMRDDLAASLGADGRFYVIGGDDAGSQPLGTNEAYTATTNCGGSPTAARVISFNAQWSATEVVLHWKTNNRLNIAGFWVYAAGHQLNPQLIPVHAGPKYTYRTPWSAGGPFTLVILLKNGTSIRITAR